MNAYQVVDTFEQTIADFSGATYGVAVESCSAALFLSCVYSRVEEVTIPHLNYPSVPCQIIHAGGRVKFSKQKWYGIYKLEPYLIYDSALRFTKDMYIPDSFYCLSFHAKKHIPIGRGGMILTDNYAAYKWFKKARFDGRNECPLYADVIEMIGWNMYMTPEQASRGLMLFDTIKDKNLPDIPVEDQQYPDLSQIKAYQKEK